jgi:hypothetical protein
MSDWTFLNRHRIASGAYSSSPDDGFNGAFQFPIPGEARRICVVASDGMGWKHVSVSFGQASPRTPSWEIMCAVKNLFWNPEDCVIQFHPPESVRLNIHPGCLHLWQPLDSMGNPHQIQTPNILLV